MLAAVGACRILGVRDRLFPFSILQGSAGQSLIPEEKKVLAARGRARALWWCVATVGDRAV